MIDDKAATARWLGSGLVITITALATLKLLAIFQVNGLSIVELGLLALFCMLLSWIAVAFWVACLGAYELWNGPTPLPLPLRKMGVTAVTSRSRTVLAVPVYNEDCAEVFARIEAMQESLRQVGAIDRFDFFVLSDSNDEQCREAEASACRRLRGRHADARLYYRRRASNTGRKSGNIADFCRNWGALYDYMVVLDADSLMTGRTLVRLVELMDASPRAALIQVAPLLVGGESLFARIQQFASWVYGPVYSAGLARLQGADGNYWGHNAIIRVEAFMQHCGLPVLPGHPPFGGEIMSHDFVEAALLRRAGWDVWLASNLDGSYEATPPDLIAHLKRDQRWCQGNLQHIKLVFARGLRLQSRMHLAFGVMSYLSSPLWLLLIVLFSADAALIENAAPVTFVGRYPVLTWPVSHVTAFVGLIMATAVLLYGSKILAVALLLRDAEVVRRYGGARALLLSAVAEIVVSTLLAPILMLSHTWFVTNALLGRTIEWGRQQRGADGICFGASVSAFAAHTLAAIVSGLLVWYWIPDSFWWFLPLLLGLASASLLCWLTSAATWGAAARRRNLFVVPSETVGIPVLQRADALLADGRRVRGSGECAAERQRESWQAA
jgi:membrane glycosyltransferase